MKKSVFSLIALLLALSLSSCGIIKINPRPEATTAATTTETGALPATTAAAGDDTTTGGSQSPSSPDRDDYLAALPDADLSRVSMLITGTRDSVLFPEQSATFIDVARYERINELEKMYKASIVTSYADMDSINAGLRADELSGNYFADIICIPASEIGQLYADGILKNIRSLPYVNPEAPYYYSSSVSAFSTAGGLWAIASEAVIDPDCMYGVYVNTDMLASLGAGSLYATVKRGEWTYDLMLSLAKEAYGSSAEGKTVYGLSAAAARATTERTVFTSCGLEYVTAGKGVIPVLAEPGERADKAVHIAKSILDSETLYNPEGTESALSLFYGGGSLFYTGTLDATVALCDSAYNWGILPCPVQEAGDGYTTPLSPETAVLAVPASCTKIEETGIVIEALSVISMGTLKDAYIETSMNWYVRDDGTLSMLDIIADNVRYSFTDAFCGVYVSIAAATTEAFSSAIWSSYYGYSYYFAKNSTRAQYVLERSFS